MEQKYGRQRGDSTLDKELSIQRDKYERHVYQHTSYPDDKKKWAERELRKIPLEMGQRIDDDSDEGT